MRVLLVSRYPRMDVPAWKREVAGQLSGAGIDVAVLYSRSSLVDQAAAGLEQYGAGIVSTYLRRRPGSADAPAAEPAVSLAAWARDHGAPVFEHRRLGDPEALADVRSWQPDVAVLAGADIAAKAFLEIPRTGTLNPHYGLLPAYRGMNVTEWAIYHGDPVGVTVHWVDPGIDTGAIAVQESIEIEPADTLETLRTKHQQLAARLLVDTVLRVRDGEMPATPQELDAGRQYYRMHPALKARVERALREGRSRSLQTS